MPALCDINTLLALCFDAHEHHPIALGWLNERSVGSVIVCRITQLGLLRLLCNAKVMGEHVCSQRDAWAIYDQISLDDRFLFYAEPEGIEAFLRTYTQSSLSAHRVWQDAYLAAFARAAGLQLVTFDHDFKQFGGLSLINPSDLA